MFSYVRYFFITFIIKTICNLPWLCDNVSACPCCCRARSIGRHQWNCYLPPRTLSVCSGSSERNTNNATINSIKFHCTFMVGKCIWNTHSFFHPPSHSYVRPSVSLCVCPSTSITTSHSCIQRIHHRSAVERNCKQTSRAVKEQTLHSLTTIRVSGRGVGDVCAIYRDENKSNVRGLSVQIVTQCNYALMEIKMYSMQTVRTMELFNIERYER